MKILSTTLILFLLTLLFLWSAAMAAEKIDINSASFEELQKIKWVGPSVAQQIIEARPFYSLEELKTKIGFIGEKRLADIKEQGIAWVDPNFGQAQPPQSKNETLSQAETQLKTITYPSGIIINEILPSPIGPDEKEEWIEIFNQNDFEVDLSDWQISDNKGTAKTYTFPNGTIIAPKSFLVLSRSTTKITLNNGGDSLNLIQPDGKIVDSVSYENAPRGQSYNQTDSKWVWGAILTPGLVNIISAPIQEVKPSREEIKKAALEKETEKALLKKELAAISEPFQEAGGRQIPKFLSLFLIALAPAISSGAIILIIKKRLKIG